MRCVYDGRGVLVVVPGRFCRATLYYVLALLDTYGSSGGDPLHFCGSACRIPVKNVHCLKLRDKGNSCSLRMGSRHLIDTRIRRK